jgi:hypothetical protein
MRQVDEESKEGENGCCTCYTSMNMEHSKLFISTEED